MKSTPPHSLTLDFHLPGLVAFSTCRGCVDEANPYSGFNACHYTGDSPAHVAECRHQVALWLGLPSPDSLILPRQTHSVNIATVDSLTSAGSLTDIDGLVTMDPDVAIGVSTADCVPLVMVDPMARVAAVVHSGWRGTVGRIALNALRAMARLGASPARVHVAMGPSICPSCFEVGEEVASAFCEAFPGVDGIILRRPQMKPHVSLPRAIAVTLTEGGVPESNIGVPVACSRCEPLRFFSARRLGINSGRTLTVCRLSDC
ncbi:MAG: polyphenol oxidase family protein [Pseudoflavonifractor sp.]|nr:polyphenol oxidase family protein [Alloprevotella sp.]MCM1116828.1 polyphenol oxidase family protein [Pseudoflavonifractor sp.]